MTVSGGIGSTGFLASAGRFCARRRAAVIIAWLALLVAATLGHHLLGGSYDDDFTLLVDATHAIVSDA